MASDVPAAKSAQACIAFPLRLNRGLLEKAYERDAYLSILGIMARTPRGSWIGHEAFGFNEFFEEVSREGHSREHRIRLAAATVSEINSVLADLGLRNYSVDSLICEAGENDGHHEVHGMERRGQVSEGRAVTLTLREIGSDRTIRCVV